jgi:hypothetical protein
VSFIIGLPRRERHPRVVYLEISLGSGEKVRLLRVTGTRGVGASLRTSVTVHL